MQERWAAEAGLPRGSQGRTGRDGSAGCRRPPLGLSHAARLALLCAVSNSRATHGVRRQSRTCHAHPNHPVISVQPDTGSFRSSHRWPLTGWPRRGRAVSPAPTVSGPVRENGAPAIPSLRCLSLPLTEPCCSTSEVRGLRARTRARIPSPAPCLSGPDPILPGAVRPGRWRTGGGGQTEREHSAWLPTAKSARTVESGYALPSTTGCSTVVEIPRKQASNAATERNSSCEHSNGGRQAH